jgi:hypothetical protein
MTRIIYNADGVYIPDKTRRGVRIKCWGGGGGGARGDHDGSQCWGGSGGGGSAFAQGPLAVEKGLAVPIVVGRGGAGASLTVPAKKGGDSYAGRRKEILAKGGGPGAGLNSDYATQLAVGGLAKDSRGKVRFTGGNAELSGNFDLDSGGGGGGGAGSLVAHGDLGTAGGDVFGGQGGFQLYDEGAGGHGADTPQFVAPREAEAGYAPGGGGGGGSIGLHYAQPVIGGIAGGFAVVVPPLDPVTGPVTIGFTIYLIPDLSAFGTYDPDSGPYAFVVEWADETWLQRAYADQCGVLLADLSGSRSFVDEGPPVHFQAVADARFPGAILALSGFFSNYPPDELSTHGPHAFSFGGHMYVIGLHGERSAKQTIAVSVARD